MLDLFQIYNKLTLDQNGTGKLVKMGVVLGRRKRGNLKVGILKQVQIQIYHTYKQYVLEILVKEKFFGVFQQNYVSNMEGYLRFYSKL